MEKEEIALLAQLMTALREAVEKLEKAYENKKAVELSEAKREILNLQAKIDKLI